MRRPERARADLLGAPRPAPRSPARSAPPTAAPAGPETFRRGSEQRLGRTHAPRFAGRQNEPRRSLGQHGLRGAGCSPAQTPTSRASASRTPRCGAPRSSPPPPRWRSPPAKWRRCPGPWARGCRSNAARGDAFLFQFPDHVQHLALAADHGDVARRRGDRQLQHAHVVAMAARHDDDVAGLVDGQLAERLPRTRRRAPPPLPETARGWRSFRGRRSPRWRSPPAWPTFDRLFEMWPRAENERVRNGQHRLDEHVQLAAADQAVVVGGVLLPG